MSTDDGAIPHLPDSIWRNRNVVLVLGGGVINDIGDWMLMVALPVYVYLETGSGAATAAIFVIELIVGTLFGAWGGSLADRWNLRRVLIATNIAQAVSLLPLLAVTPDRIWPVFVVSAVQSLIVQLNNPAVFAFLPRLVREDQLIKVNAAAASGGSLARLIGSPVGGILVAVGGLTAVVAVDVVTFLVGGASAWMVSRQASADYAEADDEPIDTSIRAGLTEIRRHPAMSALVGVQSLAMVSFAAFNVIFIVFVADELGGGGTEVGLIRGSAAFGGIVAAAVIGGIAHDRDPARLMAFGYISFGIVGLGFVNAPSFTTALWLYLILFGLTGFPNVMSQVGARSAAQQLCPPEVLGRLGGVMSATGTVGAGIGAIGAGLLIDQVSARLLFNVQTLNILLCGMLAYTFVVRPRNARLATLGSRTEVSHPS